MKVEMIKAGPIKGIPKKPGDVVDVDDVLGARLYEFGYAREYDPKAKTAEKKIPAKTAEDQEAKSAQTAEKRTPRKKTAEKKA